jgi:hypothetical protein
MANEVLLKIGTQILFGDHAGDYVGGTGNNKLEVGTPTDVQISCANLAAGAARQSVKVDLGATRARAYSVMMSLEMASDPVAGESVDLYWSPSPSGTAAVANGGGCSGADAAYTGYAASTLAEGLLNLIFVGSMSLAVMNDADGVPQLEMIGIFSPPDRYGSLVVRNGSAAVALHSDDVEFGVSFQPIIDEIQDAS